MDSTENYNICAKCGKINGESAFSCSECGAVLSSPQLNRPPAAPRLWFLTDTGMLIKITITIALLVGAGLLVKYGIESFYFAVMDTNPYPTDTTSATTKFFTALHADDYPACYSLLTSTRKAATVIGLQDRQGGYWVQFDRIKNYLTKRAGPDFAAHMKIDPSGTQITFQNDIVLNIRFDRSKDFNQVTHFAIDEILEFPIDPAPGLGIGERNRQLEQLIQEIESPRRSFVPVANYDNLQEILLFHPEESLLQTQQRLIDAFQNAWSLDVRHSVLDHLIREFSSQPLTYRFLSELAYNDHAISQLQKTAQAAIGYYSDTTSPQP